MLLFFAAGCNNNQNQSNMETQVKAEVTKTTTATSKDGTVIAYEKTGKGPCIILVNGALSYRKLYVGKDQLAEMLAKNFSLIF